MAEEKRRALVESAFVAEQNRSLVIGGRLLLAILPVIAVWVTIENGFPEAFFFYPFLIGFGLLGLSPVLVSRLGGHPWWRYVPPAIGVALFTVLVMSPNPLDDYSIPAGLRTRRGNELYLFFFIGLSLFTYNPRIVMWTGFCAALSWSLATVWFIFTSGTMARIPEEEWALFSHAERLRILGDPRRVDIGQWIRQVLTLLGVSALLAGFVQRARALVLQQAEAERQRTNLSRYFSPRVADELAQSDEPLTATRTQNVAVLFVDIVGFTELSATRPPVAVIDLLREFHRRMAQSVFRHEGTLDKYLGDGIMATFGTPHPGKHDARNALECGKSMLRSIEQWNRERAERGGTPVEIGIGIHHGPVVLGDIGSAEQLEFAVIGDTVNVASRIERLAREKDCRLLVSQNVIDAIGPELGEICGATRLGPVPIRGREQPMMLWCAG